MCNIRARNNAQEAHVTGSVLSSFSSRSLAQYQKVLSHHKFCSAPSNSQSWLCGDYYTLFCFLARWQLDCHLWIHIVKCWKASKKPVSLSLLKDGNLAYQK